MDFFIVFAISLFLSAFLTVVMKKVALFFQVVDLPGGRKIHQQPIPLLGGVAVFLSFFIVLFLFANRFLAGNLELRHLLGFFIGGLIIIIGGALDDKYNLSARQQLIFPLLAVLAVIIGGVEIEKITNPLGGYINLRDLFVVGPLLIAAWLLGMMYTTKLLDGVDGLVSGIGLIGSLIIFLFTLTTKYYQPDIALAAAALVGAAGGFLIFNFNPAKIFLGEGGSLFFGYALGVLAIISGGKIAIALLIMGIPILDVAWTIVRRLWQGKNPLKFADKKHLHHRLLSLGLSQRQTVAFFYVTSFVFGASGLFLQSRGKFLALTILLALMLALVLLLRYLDKRQEFKKPSLLLHICCAPCGAYVTKELLLPKYRVTWFFYNPNLVSLAEYNKRLAPVKLLAREWGIKLIAAPYEHATWLKKIKGREADPERGGRCLICYLDRLRETASLAAKKRFDFFSTTLLTSPYKDKEVIMKQSEDLASTSGVKFLAAEFLAADVYRRSQDLVKELGIYRQKFCGCEFSCQQATNNEKKSSLKKQIVNIGLFLGIIFVFSFNTVSAQELKPEVDTDGDGYSDAAEIAAGWSPYNPASIKIGESDVDGDGVNDYFEYLFKTNPFVKDTDGDGFDDFAEIDSAHDPLSTSTQLFARRIEIYLKSQKLAFFINGIKWREFTTSTGRPGMATPKGEFRVTNKISKAWSKTYGLWMPFWLGLDRGGIGIHELPVWPGGYREGENHLGKPVSHGCIRLGVGPAKYLYERIDVGTKVYIKD